MQKTPLQPSEAKIQQNFSESAIQQSLVRWFRGEFSQRIAPHIGNKIWHCPNENQQRLMVIGLLPGVPDLECYVGTSNVPLYFEVKTLDEKLSRLSPAQKDFQKWCKETNKAYFVVRTLESFQKIILGL